MKSGWQGWALWQRGQSHCLGCILNLSSALGSGQRIHKLRTSESSKTEMSECVRETAPESPRAQWRTVLVGQCSREAASERWRDRDLLFDTHCVLFSQKELGMFAQSSVALHHQFNPKFQTLFQPCNLMGAMQLIEDFSTHVSVDWSPRKTVKKTGKEQWLTSRSFLQWDLEPYPTEHFQGWFPRKEEHRIFIVPCFWLLPSICTYFWGSRITW